VLRVIVLKRFVEWKIILHKSLFNFSDVVMTSKNVKLCRETIFTKSCGGKQWYVVWKFHHGPNQNAKEKRGKEDKSKIMLVYRCFTNDSY